MLYYEQIVRQIYNRALQCFSLYISTHKSKPQAAIRELGEDLWSITTFLGAEGSRNGR